MHQLIVRTGGRSQFSAGLRTRMEGRCQILVNRNSFETVYCKLQHHGPYTLNSSVIILMIKQHEISYVTDGESVKKYEVK